MEIANLTSNIVLTGDLDLSNTSLTTPTEILDSAVENAKVSVGIKIEF